VTADALHCNRRTVAEIIGGGGDYCLTLKVNQDSLQIGCPVLFRRGFTRPSKAFAFNLHHKFTPRVGEL
jgi:hypothetical protein